MGPTDLSDGIAIATQIAGLIKELSGESMRAAKLGGELRTRNINLPAGISLKRFVKEHPSIFVFEGASTGEGGGQEAPLLFDAAKS